VARPIFSQFIPTPHDDKHHGGHSAILPSPSNYLLSLL
jgi:hypothetical protein